MSELPFKAEYAKTGRAGCKGCKLNIGKDSLRLAVMVQSAFHDGKNPNWFHYSCFFKKQRPASEDLIDGFSKLRKEDQDNIVEKIAGLVGVVAPEPKGKGKGKKRAGSSNEAASKMSAQLLNDFGIEYAKSGRASCPGCLLKISKDEVRIKKTVHDTEIGMKFGGQALWHHVECFAQLRTELGWLETGALLPGFANLDKEDQANVKKHLPPIKQDVDEPDSKKIKKEEKVDGEAKKLEEIIAKQNKEYFKIRDKLKAHTNKKNWIEILHRNKQAVPEGNSEVLDHVTDVIVFGALAACPKCKDGRFVLSNSAYICNGNMSEWAKCGNIVKSPERKAVYIPSAIKEQQSFLKSKFKAQERALKATAFILPMPTKVKKEEGDDMEGPRIIREKPPLYNMEFVIIGQLEQSKDDIKKAIQRMGGKLGTKVHDKVAAIISTEKEVEKLGSKMQEAKDFGIQVVPEDFLDAVKAGGAISFITSKSICDWGTDPNVRIPQEDLTKSKSKSIYTKSVAKSATFKLKNGTAVDPESGLDDVAHVYCEGKMKYFAILGKVDIQADKNSYYKIQLLESDSKSKRKYWIFRSWGRISTTIGDKRTEKCDGLEDAKTRFEELYEKQTGNYFGEKKFVKYPGRYYKMDIDYGDEKEVVKLDKSDIKSKLAVPVQDLIKLLFDVDNMKKVMLEFDLDLEKMPLGKISQKQLREAMKVLNEISGLIQSGAEAPLFLAASNRFYTLIPHDFGVQRPPVLDTVEQLSQKNEMLESLMEMELAYELLKEETDTKKNPIDGHYEQLKSDIVPLDKSTEEFILLQDYVINTHAATHANFELEIQDVFKVSRSGEERRYKPFKKLHNRQLLWHGSRLTNYVGILSHGLKIAPPDAPVTGYMFGKGIYFADMVSKSANYCCTSTQNSTGLMLLCEVALGDMMECGAAKYVTKLPKDKHSTKGMGKTYPQPDEAHVRDDGVIIPIGKPVNDDKIKSSLLYNEFIVYDAAQVKVQYLFKMNFKHKF